MNYSIIIYILGWIMNVEAVCMLVPGITALIYREKSGIAFLRTIQLKAVVTRPSRA